MKTFLVLAPILTVLWASVVRDYPKWIAATTDLKLRRRVRIFALFGGGGSLFAALALLVSALYDSAYAAAFVGVVCGLLDLVLFRTFFRRDPSKDG